MDGDAVPLQDPFLAFRNNSYDVQVGTSAVLGGVKSICNRFSLEILSDVSILTIRTLAHV